MQREGEICNQLGTYKSSCCDAELVVAAGAKFPRCSKHPDKPTEWRLLPELKIRKAAGKKK
jgi:hypothetical protein